jgi:nucleoside-diphosphate-sugar epimerase
MKIVITGALGHIGSRVIREMPSVFPRAEIVLLDNLSTQRYCSLFNLPSSGRYRFLEADILTADLASVFSGVDVVVHLAAITNASASFEIKNQVERVNFVGAQRVAQACVEAGCALIFPSTTSVYGVQAGVVDEDCPITDLRPQSPYAESKLKAEQYLQTLGKTEGLRFVICRFGTICGTSIGMRFHTAFFIIDNDMFNNETYNVVTVNTTVREICKLIEETVPDITIEYVDSKIMNQLSYTVSNEKFGEAGFEFSGDLRTGILDTIGMLGNGRWQ